MKFWLGVTDNNWFNFLSSRKLEEVNFWHIVSNRRQDIEHEISDLIILLTYLCKDLNIKIDDAVRRKIMINKEKYPVDKAKGVATKYDRFV